TYLANSSFVMIDHYGLSPAMYSVAFGVNAAAFIAASQFTGTLGERFGLVNLVKFGVGCCGAALVAKQMNIAAMAPPQPTRPNLTSVTSPKPSPRAPVHCQAPLNAPPCQPEAKPHVAGGRPARAATHHADEGRWGSAAWHQPTA
ncbi:hypothetical protein JL996_19255, partial [Acinetobacter baumannii]|nr:hypothetical protein [Acinetobacter baumannii]